MLQPTREDVRRFFCDAWGRHRAGQPASPLERIAIATILEHPEYQPLLEDVDAALARDFTVESGRENPFLHLSMHLSLEEQASIDQPPGIRECITRLEQLAGSRHEAMHEAMECLGEIVWRAQRGSLPPDLADINVLYLECLRLRVERKTP